MPDTQAVLKAILFGSWLLLLLLLTAPLLLAEEASIGLWLMQCIPLLLTLPGIRHRNSRALQWLCFLVLFCFLRGILQVFSSDIRMQTLGGLTTLSCIVLFTAAIVTLRCRTRTQPRE